MKNVFKEISEAVTQIQRGEDNLRAELVKLGEGHYTVRIVNDGHKSSTK